MNILDSLRSYYKENKMSRFLANGFFFFILLSYLLPVILALLGLDQLSSTYFNFRAKTLGLDSIISLPLILVFITSYTLSILNNKTLGTISFIILSLNLCFLLFGSLMSGDAFSLKDLLIFLPLLFLLLLIVFNKLEKDKNKKIHKLNHFSALISIVIPLLFLGLIGKFAFSFMI